MRRTRWKRDKTLAARRRRWFRWGRSLMAHLKNGPFQTEAQVNESWDSVYAWAKRRIARLERRGMAKERTRRGRRLMARWVNEAD